jgi:pyruvate dehydrogenase E1 component beta subunit
VRRVAAAEVPLPYAKPLELAAMPDAAALTRVIHEVLDGSGFTSKGASNV